MNAIIQDTVTVVDTVSTGGGISVTFGVIWAAVGFLIGNGSGATIAFRIFDKRAKTKEVLLEISDIAWEARRMLRAGFKSQPTGETPQITLELITWARDIITGFDQVESKLKELRRLAASAPKKTKTIIRDTTVAFDQAAGVINQVFASGRAIPGNQDTQDKLSTTFALMMSVLDGLTRLLPDELRDREDGYNRP
jgi:hypothetical protein